MASSRIRVYSLHRSLTELGHQAVLGHSPDSDVLYIQKRVSWETLEFARAAKAAGSVVLYDVDDYGGPVWCEGSERCFFEMIRLADAVTTDTDGHNEQLVHHYGARRVEIVPDCVDYHPSGPIRPPI
ncbi:MAG TPA: hypothetical protein VJX67_24240, partial [Blastocatellia bacterium]|nr:hypothetical protein [Blastocatellia bacterium]